jgi:hypothetical protein
MTLAASPLVSRGPGDPPDLNPAALVVGVAGDWESHTQRAVKQIGWLKYVEPALRYVLQLGDLRFTPDNLPTRATRTDQTFLDEIDSACRRHQMDMVLVTPGNHDDWARMNAWWKAHPGEPMQVSEHVWMLPRGSRFGLGGRTFLSFGGAVSVNQAALTEGRNWWREEAPTQAEADDAAASGLADVLLLHEATDADIPPVTRRLASKRRSRRFDHLQESAHSRQVVSTLRDRVQPTVTLHGHMDVAGSCRLPDGRRVYSLADATSIGNAGILTLADLSWRWLDRVRPADDLAGDDRG